MPTPLRTNMHNGGERLYRQRQRRDVQSGRVGRVGDGNAVQHEQRHIAEDNAQRRDAAAQTAAWAAVKEVFEGEGETRGRRERAERTLGLTSGRLQSVQRAPRHRRKRGGAPFAQLARAKRCSTQTHDKTASNTAGKLRTARDGAGPVGPRVFEKASTRSQQLDKSSTQATRELTRTATCSAERAAHIACRRNCRPSYPALPACNASTSQPAQRQGHAPRVAKEAPVKQTGRTLTRIS